MKLSAVFERERLLIIFLFMMVAAIVLSPLASNTKLPHLMDYFSHIALIAQAQVGMSEGQFPLRIAPLEHFGWRYPIFQFYSPTSYTFAGLIYYWLTPSNPLIALKLTAWLVMVLGGCYMYKLTNWLLHSKPAALLASVIYLTSPYYLIVIGEVGGFNEALALGLVPCVLFYTFQRYLHPAKNITLLQASLVWYLLATVHIITFAYTSFFVGLLLIFITLKNPRQWLNLFDTGLAYLFGVLLALWYLGPVYLYKDFLNTDRLYGSHYLFNSYKPSFANLISPIQNISHRDMLSTGFVDKISRIHPSLGMPILFGLAICVYIFFSKSKSENPRTNDWMAPLLLVFAVAFLMVWLPFNFADVLPRLLMVGQYSWRILGQVIWIGALLFAWAVCWLFNNKLDARHTALGLFLILIATSAWVPATDVDMLPINMSEFIKNPIIPFQPDMYLIDAKRHLELVNNIDRVSIESLFHNKELNLNQLYKLPVSVFRAANHPVLLVRGVIPSEEKFLPQEIGVWVGGTLANTVILQPGFFSWEIPLGDVKKFGKAVTSIPVQFRLLKKYNISDTLFFESIEIGGFQKNADIIDAKLAKTACEQKANTTICHFDVSSAIKFIELPVIYYPDLLSVTLNGDTIPYSSMLYGDMLLTTIKPLPGVLNTVKIEFRGLVWANTFSAVGWYLWLFFLVYIALKNFTKKTQQ